MKSFLVIMSFFSFLFGSSKQQNDAITILDQASFKSAISSKKVQLVDVRTLGEYQKGHIQNAVNIDFFKQNSFSSSFKTFNKEEPIYLYCRSGHRSRKAAKKLYNLGFKKIFDLKGGYLNWN